MSSKAAVQAILREIEALGDDERLELEQELSRRLERKWEEQIAQARREAAERGIDQAAIDQAIERRRYGT
jgi:acetyl-CoA carboxylase carboxyltransferase component